MARARRNSKVVKIVAETTQAPVVTGNLAVATASELVIDGLAELQAKTAELKQTKRLFMEQESRRKWEQETLAKNPNYVVGSLRPATAKDGGKFVHGWVCRIKCEGCGTERLVNKQDAKQTRFCEACRKSTSKAKSKNHRAAKKSAGMTPESIQAQIDALTAQLEKIA